MKAVNILMIRLRVRMSFFLSLGAVAFFLLTQFQFAVSSSATTITCSGHCYNIGAFDIANYPNAYIQGDAMDIEADCISSGSQNAFVTAESWVYTVAPGSSYWVEAGIANGLKNLTVADTKTYLYYADNRPNGGGYNEHDGADGTATTGVYYHEDIHATSSNTWAVSIGSLTGSSTANPGPSSHLAVGSEAYNSPNVKVSMHAINQKFYDGNGALSSGWEYTQGHEHSFSSPSGYPTPTYGSGYTSTSAYVNC